VRHLGVSVAQGTFIVFWTVDFGSANEAAQSGDCSLSPANSPPTAAFTAPMQSNEGSVVSFDAMTSSDPDGDPLTYSWDFGDGGIGSGAVPMHRFDDDGNFAITLTVSDGRGGTATATRMLEIVNAAPLISAMTGPSGPTAPGAPVSITGSFSDAGALDTHSVEIAWGDGTTSSAVVTGTSAKSFSASHSYTNEGSYAVTATVTDNGGAMASQSVDVVIKSETPAEQNVMVVGAGSIRTSRDGSHHQKQNGRLTFHFAGSNRRGAVQGAASARLPDGGKSFLSTTTQRLDVVKNRITMEGTGSLNGRKGYEFMLTAHAGDRGDLLRLRIWESSTGRVVFDSQPDAPDDADPSSKVNGSIRIIRFR
jgi:PKD repeat protein